VQNTEVSRQKVYYCHLSAIAASEFQLDLC